jgi:hypothetical protein
VIELRQQAHVRGDSQQPFLTIILDQASVGQGAMRVEAPKECVEQKRAAQTDINMHLPTLSWQADALASWSTTKYADDLTALMDFFVVITKQQSQAHVWLATSDYSYQTWLTKGESHRSNQRSLHCTIMAMYSV